MRISSGATVRVSSPRCVQIFLGASERTWHYYTVLSFYRCALVPSKILWHGLDKSITDSFFLTSFKWTYSTVLEMTLLFHGRLKDFLSVRHAESVVGSLKPSTKSGRKTRYLILHSSLKTSISYFYLSQITFNHLYERFSIYLGSKTSLSARQYVSPTLDSVSVL
jgi:hypothetical protein